MIGKELFDYIMSFAPQFRGPKTAKQYQALIRKILKPYDAQFNTTYDDTNTALSILTVGGFFDGDLDFGKKDIQMYMVVNKFQLNDIFNLTDDDIQVLLVELFKTLMHEMRHRYQFEKRGFEVCRQYRANVMNEDLKQEMEYYGNDDELDAYAQEAVIEQQLYGSSPTLAKYHELFYEHDDKLYNKLLKKMCKLHG